MRLPTRAPRVTHGNRKISPLTPSSLANRQASRALRRRPAGFRPGPPRAGERGVAVRHPQPPQRGVAARHRQREGDATARRCEGSCPFHLVAFPRPSVAFQTRPAPRRRAASARSGRGSPRNRANPRAFATIPRRAGGREPPRPRDRKTRGVPSVLPSPSSSFSALRRSKRRTAGFLAKISAESAVSLLRKCQLARAAGTFFSVLFHLRDAIATARTASDRPLRSIIFVNFKHDADQRRVFVRRARSVRDHRG